MVCAGQCEAPVDLFTTKDFYEHRALCSNAIRCNRSFTIEPQHHATEVAIPPQRFAVDRGVAFSPLTKLYIALRRRSI